MVEIDEKNIEEAPDPKAKITEEDLAEQMKDLSPAKLLKWLQENRDRI